MSRARPAIVSLSLALLAVHASAHADDANLARGANARQSSIAVGGEPARAVDGNRDGTWGAGSVTHTAGEVNAWLEVDLGEARSIASVIVYNRTDCCAERLSMVSVELSEVPCDAAPKVLGRLPLVPMAGVLAARTQLDFAGAPRARYVCLPQPIATPLSVDEVEVLPGTTPSVPAPTEATNLARGAGTRQTSTVLGAEAARAVDGNRDSA